MRKACNYKYTEAGKCHIHNTLMFLDAFFLVFRAFFCESLELIEFLCLHQKGYTLSFFSLH